MRQIHPIIYISRSGDYIQPIHAAAAAAALRKLQRTALIDNTEHGHESRHQHQPLLLAGGPTGHCPMNEPHRGGLVAELSFIHPPVQRNERGDAG